MSPARRRLLAALVGTTALPLSGCTTGDASSPPTSATPATPAGPATSTDSATPTEQSPGTTRPSQTPTATPAQTPDTTPTPAPVPEVTVALTVTNVDDTAHSLVTSVLADGAVAHRATAAVVEPGEAVALSATLSGPGPYTFAFETETVTATHVWRPADCPDLRLDVRLESAETVQVTERC
jgi:hypothetical protein